MCVCVCGYVFVDSCIFVFFNWVERWSVNCSHSMWVGVRILRCSESPDCILVQDLSLLVQLLSLLLIISAEVTRAQLGFTMKVISLQTKFYYCQSSNQLRYSYHLHFRHLSTMGSRVCYSCCQCEKHQEECLPSTMKPSYETPALANGSYNQEDLIGADSQIPLAFGLNLVNQI